MSAQLQQPSCLVVPVDAETTWFKAFVAQCWFKSTTHMVHSVLYTAVQNLLYICGSTFDIEVLVDP